LIIYRFKIHDLSRDRLAYTTLSEIQAFSMGKLSSLEDGICQWKVLAKLNTLEAMIGQGVVLGLKHSLEFTICHGINFIELHVHDSGFVTGMV
jgi:hypothetical protein